MQAASTSSQRMLDAAGLLANPVTKLVLTAGLASTVRRIQRHGRYRQLGTQASPQLGMKHGCASNTDPAEFITRPVCTTGMCIAFTQTTRQYDSIITAVWPQQQLQCYTAVRLVEPTNEAIMGLRLVNRRQDPPSAEARCSACDFVKKARLR